MAPKSRFLQAFPGGDALNQMGKACSEWGLGGQPWAVLDVHHYFSCTRRRDCRRRRRRCHCCCC